MGAYISRSMTLQTHAAENTSSALFANTSFYTKSDDLITETTQDVSTITADSTGEQVPIPASGSSSSGADGVGSTVFLLMVAICSLLILTVVSLTAMCVYIVRTKKFVFLALIVGFRRFDITLILGIYKLYYINFIIITVFLNLFRKNNILGQNNYIRTNFCIYYY